MVVSYSSFPSLSFIFSSPFSPLFFSSSPFLLYSLPFSSPTFHLSSIFFSSLNSLFLYWLIFYYIPFSPLLSFFCSALVSPSLSSLVSSSSLYTALIADHDSFYCKTWVFLNLFFFLARHNPPITIHEKWPLEPSEMFPVSLEVRFDNNQSRTSCWVFEVQSSYIYTLKGTLISIFRFTSSKPNLRQVIGKCEAARPVRDNC